ncbi:MAG: VapC toxin family PIN domain ribonuclease [Acidobacteria bacterium]|nr:VapC toxin family PIN domain ribonuclease [Acidobacteriota bacterium]MCI0620525.1 VapC toxin family PIN domain ribonuclease [Acidobacteriota bacterium]MCI0722413.1 VapC toxin family PIN domain ribonuclease [Acidobacteriota bacterium]
MSVYLLDINVLVALSWANHEQHEAASSWFRTHQRSGWATCPLTQAGFVRVSSNPRVVPDAPPPAKALEILETNLSHPAHRFWKLDIGLSDAVSPFADRFAGHQQTTDAYLLGLRSQAWNSGELRFQYRGVAGAAITPSQGPSKSSKRNSSEVRLFPSRFGAD